MNVTYNSKTFACATAYKGTDYVRLVDSTGSVVAVFQGVQDFSLFTLTDGEWTNVPEASNCSLVVMSPDGSFHKSDSKARDVAKALPNIITCRQQIDRTLVSNGSYPVNVVPANTVYNSKLSTSEAFYTIVDNSDGNNGGYLLRILKPGYVLINYTLFFKSSVVDDTTVASFAKRTVDLTTDKNNPSDGIPTQRQSITTQLTVCSNDGVNNVYYTAALPSTLLKVSTSPCEINITLEGVVTSDNSLTLMKHSYLTMQFFEV